MPGVCNFVDARTKWLDGALKAALDEGVEQVGECWLFHLFRFKP